jgi:hypothetical protein
MKAKTGCYSISTSEFVIDFLRFASDNYRNCVISLAVILCGFARLIFACRFSKVNWYNTPPQKKNCGSEKVIAV